MDQNSPDDYIESTEDSLKEQPSSLVTSNPRILIFLSSHYTSFRSHLFHAANEGTWINFQAFRCHIQTHVSENLSEVAWVKNFSLHPLPIPQFTMTPDYSPQNNFGARNLFGRRGKTIDKGTRQRNFSLPQFKFLSKRQFVWISAICLKKVSKYPWELMFQVDILLQCWMLVDRPSLPRKWSISGPSEVELHSLPLKFFSLATICGASSLNLSEKPW